jgi:predicted alpha/beta-fold hydrolase
VRTLREWDAVTVVPRFGFTDVDDYYDTAGIAGRIDQIALPALMVHSPHDPMIPPSTVEPVLRRASDLFEARWVEGAGHVFFPGDVDLGLDAPTGLGPQVIKWLES